MYKPIEIEGLSKTYVREQAQITALSKLDLSVEQGEVLALMGRNGAGKSSLIEILSTLIQPDSGRAVIEGVNVVTEGAEVRSLIGVAFQQTGLYPSGRVRQVLNFHARLVGFERRRAARRADEMVELVGLEQVASRRVGSLSGGMRRRLDLALALINDPPVLLLDEPSESLDPWSRGEIWSELCRRRDQGTSILLASQNLEEAEHIADRVAVLHNGTLWRDDIPVNAVRDVWAGDLAASP